MKGITLNLEELTDSREMLESHEPPRIRWFIYSVLLMVCCALVFASVFEMDEYVRVHGEVKPYQAVGEVITASGGRLESSFVTEGQLVSKGELLFTFDVEEAREQAAIVEQSLSKLEKAYQHTERLKQAIEQDENLFSKEGEEAEYYYRFEQYSVSGKLEENEMNVSQWNSSISEEDKKNSLNSVQKSLKEKEKLLAAYRELAEKLEAGKAYQGGETMVEAGYKEYKTRLAQAEIALEQSKKSYQEVKKAYKQQCSQKQNIEDQIADDQKAAKEAQNGMNALKRSYCVRIEAILADLQGGSEGERQSWTALKAAIEAENEFTSDNSEANKLYAQFQKEFLPQKNTYLECRQRAVDLQSAYAQQTSLISESDVENAEYAYQSAKLQVQAVTDGYRTQIQSAISSLSAEIQSLTDNMASIQLSQKEAAPDYGEDSAENRKNNAIVNVLSELSALSEKIGSAQSQLIQLEATVQNAQITAPCDGTVTLVKERNSGEILQAGTCICSIIPKEDDLKAVLYIPESEIARIQEGQKIEYAFDSMPYAEFGRLTGTVRSISLDAVADQGNQMKYYIANADFDGAALQNSKGEVRELQNGMLTEAKVISGSKKVLIWLLEKIHLVD